MKKFILSFFLAFLFFVNINKVSAASGSVTISSNSKVTVGTTFTVTVTVRANVNMSAYQFNLSYDTSHLTLIGDSSLLSVANPLDSKAKTKSVSYKFKAKAVGSAYLKISNGQFTDWLEDKEVSTTNGSKTIQIVKPTSSGNTNASSDNNEDYSKSSNSYLKSLTVDKGNLNPNFKKDVEEYSLLLEAGTESINVMPKTEDDEASVNIEGKVNLKEGENIIELKVTAENGSKRIYKIIAYVEEKNPIKINMGNQEYSVVKQTNFLKIPDGYSKEDYEFKGQKVPTFISDNKKVRLIGLKNSDGEYILGIIENDNLIPYKSLKIGDMEILVLPFPEDKIKTGYQKTTFDLNDIKYEGYEERKDFILIYGINSNTGYKNIYRYDVKEKTIQRYVENKSIISDKILLKSGIVVIAFILSFIVSTIYSSITNKVKTD